MSDDPISRKALVEEIDGKPLFKLVETDGGLWKYEAVYCGKEEAEIKTESVRKS